jgi:uncharacterized membrane protein
MNPFRRRLLWLSTALTALTGVVYFWMRNLLEPVSEWSVINHPLEPWVLKAHILVAPVMLFAVGMIAWDHIWRHIRSGLPTGRRSGWTVTLAFFPLVLTGYLLQAVTHQGVVSVLSWTHLILGIVTFAFFAYHRGVLRRRRRQRRDTGLRVVQLAPGPGHD